MEFEALQPVSSGVEETRAFCRNLTKKPWVFLEGLYMDHIGPSFLDRVPTIRALGLSA